MYNIIRFWANGARRVVDIGLTLEQAQSHCKDPQTNSETCTNKAGKDRTRKTGPWFDGFSDTIHKGRRRQ